MGGLGSGRRVSAPTHSVAIRFSLPDHAALVAAANAERLAVADVVRRAVVFYLGGNRGTGDHAKKRRGSAADGQADKRGNTDRRGKGRPGAAGN